MSNGNDWIATRVTKAGKGLHLLAPSVPTCMEKLLKGQLSERPLSKKELVTLAKELIGGMIPASPETKQ